MQEADLARPVVEVRDFATKKLEYEIYTYGAENVIIPVKEEKPSPVKELALQRISQELRKFDPQVQLEIKGEDRVIARVKNSVIARMIGKAGANIEKLENKLGIHISVEPREKTLKGEIPWQFEESGAFISLFVHPRYTGKQVDVYKGNEFVFSPYVGRKGLIKIKKKTELGRAILGAIASKKLKVLL